MNDLVTIVGDFKAKVGPDAFEQWAGTAGHFGLGETCLLVGAGQQLRLCNREHLIPA